MKPQRRDTIHTAGDLTKKEIDDMFDIELELKGNKVAEKGDLKGTGGKDVNGDIKFTNENSIHHRPTSLNGSVNEGYMSERL